MKKLVAKMRAKKQPQAPAGRITNDTLAEHREKVLAGGRKFKYPVQYQRHKLVINAIIIGVSALIVLIALGWYLLYPAQNTSEFMYRVTKVVPVPVATIDGEPVRYSSYLMKYRSAVHYLTEKEQIDANSDNGKRQIEFVKYQSMEDAIADAYATKKARELKIEVTDAEIEAYFTQQREASDQTEATYNRVIDDYYGWSPEEYREVMKSKLLRQKVSFSLDTTASSLATTIADRIGAGEADLAKLSESLNKDKADTTLYTPAAWVPRNNRDNGLAEAAAKLQKGAVSEAVKTNSASGIGYYFVKLVDSNDAQVQYEYLYVPLSMFKNDLKTTQADGHLKKFIKVDNPTAER